MTYSIYVDLAFGWAFIINLALLCISEYLLGNTVRLHRLCIDSLLISVVCTVLYVMFYSFGSIFQNTLYVLTYFLLLYLFYRFRSSKASLTFTYAVYISTSFVIALILIAIGYSLKKGLFQTTRLIICIACVIPAIYIVYCHKKNALSHKFCIYNIELAINGKTFTSSAYMDTGNSLMDLSGRNVIITDCFYAGELLGNAYIDLLEAYHNQKNFDYIKANSISDIFFCPVPCRTVSSDFFIMPGFVANSIMYRETGRAYHNITIAISPNRLSFLKDAKLLSNQNLKP